MKLYRLLDASGAVYWSETKGTLGGYTTTKIYGDLNCSRVRAAMQHSPESWERHRVYFPDEKTALAAGYRPCGSCLREKYLEYQADPDAYRKKFGL